MEDACVIYLDRLIEEKVEKLDFSLSPSFLVVDDEEIVFESPVLVHGEAYLASDHLVIHLNVDTSVKLICKLCNEPFSYPISLKHVYHTTSIEEIKGATFDMTEVLRENILLETPRFAECNTGSCPERDALSQYSTKGDDKASLPFAHLEDELNNNTE